MLKIRKVNIAARILLHLFVWALSVIAFGYIFKITGKLGFVDIVYSLLFHISICAGLYMNMYLLVPLWLNKKAYVLYSAMLVLILVVSVILNQFTYSHIAGILLPDYYFISQFNIYETALILLLYLATGTLFSLSKSWFQIHELNMKLAVVEKENLTAQIKGLKSQINPHFLFNSLNVIYSLNLKKSDETSGAIIKLSDILRYVIYDSDTDFVNISSEVELIENYLSLQKHRTGVEADVVFDHKIGDDVCIAPMLLLPLVENSFKHGVKGDIENTFVNIKLETDGKGIVFEIENNKGISDSNLSVESGGIGLDNIRSRLSLLYSNKHELLIEDTEDVFRVKMTIDV